MSDTIRLIAEFFAACVGTIAFALLFQVPRKYYPEIINRSFLFFIIPTECFYRFLK